MIDQAMDAWEQQLKTENAHSGVPGFIFRMPAIAGSAFTDPASQMMRFGELTSAPFKFWIEAAETWQRSCAAVLSGSTLPRPPRTTNKASTEARPSQ